MVNTPAVDCVVGAQLGSGPEDTPLDTLRGGRLACESFLNKSVSGNTPSISPRALHRLRAAGSGGSRCVGGRGSSSRVRAHFCRLEGVTVEHGTCPPESVVSAVTCT